MKGALLAGCTIACLAFANAAQAQDEVEVDAVDAASPEEAEDEGLSVIMVSAQRREESLQDAAVAVTALSGTELLNRGVTDTADLSKVVPALQVQPTGGAGFSLYLRGVGTLSGNSFAENAVAFNFNDVYVGRPTSTSGTFYDLERVEVVKGPQGTLYGRNATGGAINVIPRRPNFRGVGGEFTLQYGNYDHWLATGAVNVPLGDKVALRAAVQLVDRDGYLSDGTSDDEGQAGRLSLLFEPTDALSVVLVGDYYNQGGRGPGSVVVPSSTGRYVAPPLDDRVGGSDPRAQAVQAAVAAGLPAPPFCGGFGGFVRSGCVLVPRGDSSVDGQYWGLSANVEADLGPVTLTAIPAYRSSKTDFVNYLPGFLLDVTDNAEQWSLETRLASNTDGPFEYVVGAFYFKEDQDAVNFFAQGRLATTLFTPHLETESFAVFGQGSFAVTEALRLVAGARWTTETKQQQTSLGNGNPFTPDPFNPPLQATFANDLEFEEITWKAGVEWDAGPASLVYANVATGFKAGGFFVAAPPDNTFDPEKLTAYTIGSKNRFLNNRLQVNVEAFYWDYSDQQITFVGAARTATGSFASAGTTINAGQAEMYGVELETLFAITPNDLLSFNGQWLESEYKEFTVPLFSSTPAPPPTSCPFVAVRPVPGGTFYDTDCSGRPTLNSPKWSFNLGYERTFEFENGMDLILGADTKIESSRYLDITFSPEAKQDSYMMSDAFVTLEGNNDAWALTAFINNIEDKEVKAQAGNRPILNIAYSALRPPRRKASRHLVLFRIERCRARTVSAAPFDSKEDKMTTGLPARRTRMRGSIAASLACMALLAAGSPAAAQQAACAPFTWTTLGTAGGPMPTVDRAEPSNLLRAGDRYILVDTGDGTVNQLAKIGLNLGRIDAVFISHHHMDHTGGLAAVVGLRWMNNFPGQLTVFGPPGTRELVDGIVASMQPQARVGFGLGAEGTPPAESVKVVELRDAVEASLGPLVVTAAANSHFDHEGGQEPDAVSLSYRFAYQGRAITYSGDTGPSDAFARLAAGSDMLVTEIMDYDALIEEIARQRPDMPPNIRDQMHKHLFTHHLTADQVGQLAKSAKPAQVVLTHYAMPPGTLSATAGSLLEGIRAHYAGPVHFGRDLASFDVGCG